MNVPDIEVHEATSLAEASSLMARYAPDARLLAGGTDLLVDLKAGRLSIGHCVSINRVDELRGLSADESGLRIGALTTPNQLAASPLLRGPLAAIRDATRDMAAPQVRNMATVGGNIASAIPSADLPPILIVMNASVILWSPGGERSVPL
ncbi:MAG: FAD binding domain-containing protein, partial [Planctomycetes bacterium]|nr:FAD binding domain-containing protein [Planctomycetota bacterium]